MTLTSHQRPHRGASDVWLTPPDIIAALGPFDLDPCAAPHPRPWPTADLMISLPHDGLAPSWSGFVWCNPPFGPDAAGWLARMADHGNGIALCAARTETRWFVACVWQRADAVLFLHGRPYFHRADGRRAAANSGVPICLVAYGETAVERLRNSGLAGTTWQPERVGTGEVGITIEAGRVVDAIQPDDPMMGAELDDDGDVVLTDEEIAKMDAEFGEPSISDIEAAADAEGI